MNIYEAKKLSDEWVESSDKDEFPAHLPHDSKAYLEWIEDVQRADHAYTRHCKRNFMAALEALNKLVIIASIVRGAGGNLSTDGDFLAQLDDTSKLLDKLEEVS